MITLKLEQTQSEQVLEVGLQEQNVHLTLYCNGKSKINIVVADYLFTSAWTNYTALKDFIETIISIKFNGYAWILHYKSIISTFLLTAMLTSKKEQDMITNVSAEIDKGVDKDV